MGRKPLEGIKVLDMGRYIAGPYCAAMLADMGAEVIKIESPGGEFVRTLGSKIAGESLYFSVFNRNKKGITLNYRTREAKEEILPRLFRECDIVIQNFRPGVMASMGFPYEKLKEINPRLILVSMSGYGQEGEFSNRVCFDAIAQAMGGLMSMTGPVEGAPHMTGTFIADYLTGIYSAFGTMNALYNREKTGLGQEVDVALLDCIFSVLLTAVPQAIMLNEEVTRIGNLDRYSSPANCYQAEDGYIYISAGTDVFWAKTLKIVGREDLRDLPRFKTGPLRLENHKEIDAVVEEWTRKHKRAEIEEVFGEAGIPCGSVLTMREVVKHPYFHSREQIAKVQHPTMGELSLPGVTVKLSQTPGEVKLPPPLLGQHNEEIYNSLGYSEEQIAKMKEAGII